MNSIIEKKCKVVMLPTNEKTNIYIKDSKLFFDNRLEKKCNDVVYQEFYLLSNAEITKNDWFIYNGLGCKKIIATNSSINNLPQLPQNFIKVFVEEYNKGNVIKWVNVEYEQMNTTIVNRTYNDFEPKVNSKNEITIRKIKDSWNREEVEKIIRAWASYTCTGIGQYWKPIDLDNWLKENL